MELSFPRTFAPKSESTIGGTFVPGSESYMELSLPGTFASVLIGLQETYIRRSQHKRSP